MTTLLLKRWGNSLAVRIPASLANEAHLHENQEVNIRAEGGKLVLEALEERFSLAGYLEFLETVKPEDVPPTVDWGAPQGTEAGGPDDPGEWL
jgi:antitoxin MazE